MGDGSVRPVDRGKPSAALIEFIESKPEVLSNILKKRRPKALIPGCGKGYDVVALALHGFDTYGLEISGKGAATARQSGLPSDHINNQIYQSDQSI
ncbi:unnamed protein product [Clonostachys rhizophaga]|uniref:Thiol methyltransferase 2 n=1 Tax=Clonostachys rhizophaga TaxID=160324 RepID=A0A9N9W287_9HYPO|nr:unnamed protein product [Clonostachys rhizophaga]